MIIMNDDTIIRLTVFITVATDPIIVDIPKIKVKFNNIAKINVMLILLYVFQIISYTDTMLKIMQILY